MKKLLLALLFFAGCSAEPAAPIALDPVEDTLTEKSAAEETVVTPEEPAADIEVKTTVTINDFENYDADAQESVMYEGENLRVVATADSWGWDCTLEYQDSQGNPLDLPEKVLDSDATVCLYNTSGWHEISPDESYLLFTRWEANEVVLYDYSFATQALTRLMSFNTDVEGINYFRFSPSGEKVAIEVVKQDAEDYPTRVKLFILTLENDLVVHKQKTDVKAFYSCGDNRCSGEGEDFLFLDENTLQYRGTLEGTYWDLGELETIAVE